MPVINLQFAFVDTSSSLITKPLSCISIQFQDIFATLNGGKNQPGYATSLPEVATGWGIKRCPSHQYNLWFISIQPPAIWSVISTRNFSAYYGKLNGIPSVVIYIDDIIVTARRQMSTSRQQEDRWALQGSKTKSLVDLKKQDCICRNRSALQCKKLSHTYLDHCIDADGIWLVPKKVEAIQQDLAKECSQAKVLTWLPRILP